MKNTARVFAAVLLFAVGCQTEDDPTPTPQSTQAAEDGNIEEYCENTLAIETVEEPDIDFESLSEEELQEEVSTFAEEEFKPLADEIVASAPEELEQDIAVLVSALDDVIETGEFEAFETPEAQEAEDRLHAFDLENCGWNAVDVTASETDDEYAFEGIPDTIEAGATSFEFVNSGEEVHELVILKKNEGVTESVAELVELPEEEAMEMVTFVGHTEADPGDDASLVADLEAGEYAAVCFFPVGSTPEAVAEADEQEEEIEGPPHATRGMAFDFTVE